MRATLAQLKNVPESFRPAAAPIDFWPDFGPVEIPPPVLLQAAAKKKRDLLMFVGRYQYSGYMLC